jgi:uncharacterized cupredoxin-like copper-binding protein
MQRVRHRTRHGGTLLAICVATAMAVVLIGTATAGSAGTADAEIAVTLGKPKEYSLTAKPAAGKGGEVALTVRNRGTVVHEFILLRTPVKAASLKPRSDEPEKVVEPGFVAELEDVEPGDRVTLVMPLKKGHYVLLCNIDGHHAGGMHADVVLR